MHMDENVNQYLQFPFMGHRILRKANMTCHARHPPNFLIYKSQYPIEDAFKNKNKKSKA